MVRQDRILNLVKDGLLIAEDLRKKGCLPPGSPRPGCAGISFLADSIPVTRFSWPAAGARQASWALRRHWLHLSI